MKKTASLIVCVLATMLITSCSSDKESYLSQQVGRVCKVQFKRNALGSGARLPVPQDPCIADPGAAECLPACRGGGFVR